MLIDWFTTAAQIVNVLILIWLLKKFLYGPILRAMDAREKQIASRLEEADQKNQEAQQQKADFERKTHDLEKKRETLLARAQQQADEDRKELVRQVRADTDALRTDWKEGLRHEKQSVLQELQQRAVRHTCAAARHTLRELANTDLEQHLVKVWRERLEHLDPQAQDDLRQAAAESKHDAVVRSAFALSTEQRRALTRLVHQYAARKLTVDYESDDKLICGIELRVGAFKLAWSVADHLGRLQESVGDLLDEAAHKDTSEESS